MDINETFIFNNVHLTSFSLNIEVDCLDLFNKLNKK